MNKFILIVFLPLAMYAQELRSIQVKQGDCSTMAAGWICYDADSFKKIDDAMKKGIQCNVNLKVSEDKILQLSKRYQEASYDSHKWYDKTWVKMSVGIIVGFGLGVGIGTQL